MAQGVFLPSSDLGSAFMIGCLQAFLDDYPKVKFTTVTIDEKFHGLRIYFSEVDEAMVFKKGFITVGTQRVQMYPMKAFVTIYGIDQDADSTFKKDLKEAIEYNYGKVIDVSTIDDTYEFEEWLLEIDVPEFKNLKVSGREVFSEMTIFLPQWKKRFSLTLWCHECKNRGHFRHECLREVQNLYTTIPQHSIEIGDSANSRIVVKSKSEMETTGDLQTRSNSRSLSRNSLGRDKGYSKFGLEANYSFAKNVGRDVVMMRSLMAGNQKFKETSNFFKDKETKKAMKSDDTYSDAKEQHVNDKKRKRFDGMSCSYRNDDNSDNDEIYVTDDFYFIS